MNKINLSNQTKQSNSLDDFLKDIKNIGIDNKKSKEGSDFFNYVKDEIEKTNTQQKGADKLASELASGKKQNIHETMLAISHAELSLNLMVQVRNKALEAYQEIMRMPV